MRPNRTGSSLSNRRSSVSRRIANAKMKMCIRDRDEDDDGRADLIGPAALEAAHEQAHRDADDKAQQHGVHAHLDGDGQLLSEDAGDGGVDLIDVAHACLLYTSRCV